MTAPEWRISEWLNAPEPSSLGALRGRVVVACAFQMLCPSCVSHALPQMQAVHALFAPLGVATIGLHTVFEHHAAMTPVSLRAFLHEYRIGFPVGVDAPAEDGQPLPQTMRLYRMEGTPTLLLYDRSGTLRQQFFGHVPDLRLGAEIMALVNEAKTGAGVASGGPEGPACAVPPAAAQG